MAIEEQPASGIFYLCYMKIKLLVIGRTSDSRLDELIAEYSMRVGRYLPFELEVIPDLKKSKSLPETLIKEKEAKLILEKVQASDVVYLLDEKGKQHTSISFSKFLQEQMNRGHKQIVFIVGGAYGFSPEVYKRATGLLSLSKMTFSHQMVRLFFVEQLYRGFTILRNEPYHHQ